MFDGHYVTARSTTTGDQLTVTNDEQVKFTIPPTKDGPLRGRAH